MNKLDYINLIIDRLRGQTGINFQKQLSEVLREYYVYKGKKYEVPAFYGGDKKNDGWVVEDALFYQIYAPVAIKDSLKKNIQKKFSDDLEGLLKIVYEEKEWNGVVKEFVFLVNTFDNDLPEDSQRYYEQKVIELQNKFNVIFKYKVENLGYVRDLLWGVEDIVILKKIWFNISSNSCAIIDYANSDNENKSPTLKEEVFAANRIYAKSFQEPLFLHKDKNSKVNLTNLFVLQKYKQIRDEGATHAEIPMKDDLSNYLAEFFKKKKKQILFIEGSGGSGKTTLIGWLNYHYLRGDDIAKEIFDGRVVITIRLRDLDKKTIVDKGIAGAILRYLNADTYDNLEKNFPQAVMILDGFDELCMIHGTQVDHAKMIRELVELELEGFDYIITTRPCYIPTKCYEEYDVIVLQHFDVQQRKQWIKQYQSDDYCGEKIDQEVYNYIVSIEEHTTSNICDTPMTLYMLAAKEESKNYLHNSWALYHHIFYEELSKTEYNKMFPNPLRKYTHDIRELRDIIYEITEEIAFLMYQKQNQIFSLSEKELKEIINQLTEKYPALNDGDIKLISERCYGLCCYWKTNADKGVVEFLHNNIRDFFLAEKIYRHMDNLLKVLQDKGNEKKLYLLIADNMCELFSNGILETTVLEFVYLRAKYNYDNKVEDFASFEYKNKTITTVMQILSTNRLLMKCKKSLSFETELLYNSIQVFTNIITCTVQLFRHFYEPYLSENEYICWFPNISFLEGGNDNNILRSQLKECMCQDPLALENDSAITLASKGFYSGLNLQGKDLRNIGFQNSRMDNMKMSDTILCGCDFSGSILCGTDFSNADIHYASLKNADLSGCNFTGADIRGTELPDGFVSINQDEQVEHLKEMKINKLVI